MNFTRSELYLGAIYDAMRLLGYRAEEYYINIKPLAGYAGTNDQGLIYGPAVTTFGEKTSKKQDYDELDRIRLDLYKKEFFVDRPIVVLQANDTYCAHSGDITSQIYQTLGAVGFVTDGCFRDAEKIDQLGFPCFANDINPIDAINYWALTKFQIPVTIEGVLIHPGDILFGSREGIIRVPRVELTQFQTELGNVLEKEDKARGFIEKLKQSNNMTQELNNFVDEFGRW